MRLHELPARGFEIGPGSDVAATVIAIDGETAGARDRVVLASNVKRRSQAYKR
jgi:hypothetical protein